MTTDPEGHADGPNLYAYVHCSPLVYIDPNGTFGYPMHPMSTAYLHYGPRPSNLPQSNEYDLKSQQFQIDDLSIMAYGGLRGAINVIRNDLRFHGSMQALGGLAETSSGVGLILATEGIATPLAWPIMVHGLDQFIAGISTAVSGSSRSTVTEHILQSVGMSPQTAGLVNNGLSIVGSVGGFAAINASRLAIFPNIQSLAKASKITREMYRSESLYQSHLLNTHLTQLEKYGAQGYRQLQNNKIRYYGELKTPVKNGEMIGRRRVREWNPENGLKRTWHETLDGNNNVRIVRPERNDGSKIHYVFDNRGNFIGTW
jgi:hypothetical protein